LNELSLFVPRIGILHWRTAITVISLKVRGGSMKQQNIASVKPKSRLSRRGEKPLVTDTKMEKRRSPSHLTNWQFDSGK